MTVMLALLVAASASPSADIDISFERLRNHRGLVHFCATNDPRNFPDCSHDPYAIKRTIPASEDHLRISGIAPGDYALTLLHDENGNGRLDTTLGIPREGFGFSRNPVVRFGAPKFQQVRIRLAPGYSHLTIRMQYIL